MQLTFATRPSALARWQSARVIRLLQLAHPELICHEYVLNTLGKLPFGTPPDIAAYSHSTGELAEEALRAGKADAVVCSVKDLPMEKVEGILVSAIPEREAAFDVLVSTKSWTLSSLPEGARVGTSSRRRSAQLLSRRPDLEIVPLHGEIEARLERVLHDEYDAIVLAQAGLTRLGLQENISEVLSLDVMLPAPGQGALAVQCRAEDAVTQKLLASIHAPIHAAAVYAELAFARNLDGRCVFPVAAFAEKNNGTIILTGAVFSPDGRQAIRLSAVDQDPHLLGRRLAELVLERGGAELLQVRV